jgi:hypothetical protein
LLTIVAIAIASDTSAEVAAKALGELQPLPLQAVEDEANGEQLNFLKL